MSRFQDCVSRADRRVTRLLASLASAGAAACGGAGGMMSSSTPPSAPPPGAPTVNATPQLAFSPAQLTIIQRGTVTFAFGAVAHNVFFDNDPAGAPDNIPGANSNTTVQRVFATAGVYAFYCHIHPGMHGAITVVAPDTV